MIYYFIKPSGGGKSSLATALTVQFLENAYECTRDSKHKLDFLEMAPYDRLQLSINQIEELNKMGYTFKEPEHCLHSNFAIYSRYFNDLLINYDLPAFKIGLYDKKYPTKMPPPASVVVWDESQNEADGRESMQMPRRLRSWLSLHRKWDIDLLCFSQRDRVDKNIRENCTIIIIDGFEHKKDKYGFIESTTWTLLVFDSISHYELYKATLNSKYYTKTTYTFNGCVYEHYDSKEGRQYFIDCAAKNGGFSLEKADIDLSSRQKIEKHVQKHPYLPPKGFAKGEK